MIKKFLICLMLFVLSITVVCAKPKEILTIDKFLETYTPEMTEAEIFKKLKKVPFTEKYNIVNYYTGQFSSEGRVDYQLAALAMLPRKYHNDSLTLNDLTERIYDETFEDYKKMISKENFNMFFDTYLFRADKLSYQTEEAKKLYKEIFTNWELPNLSNMSLDEKHKFFENTIFLIWGDDYYYIYNRDEKYYDLAEKFLNKYLKHPELQKLEPAKSSYNIYRLGKDVLYNLNEHSYNFVLKMLEMGINPENLSYFINHVTFNGPMTEEIEQEFLRGEYDVETDIFGDTYLLSMLTGVGEFPDKYVEYLKSKGLKLNAKQKIDIINYTRSYNENCIKIIDSILENTSIKKEEALDIIIEAIKTNFNREHGALLKDVQENWLKYLINGVE